MMQQKMRGFTVVELLIVIIVIGILTVVVIVNYGGSINTTKTNQAQANATVVQKKIEAYGSANGTYPVDTTNTNYLATLNASNETALTGTGISIGTITIGTATTYTNVMVSRCTAPATPYGTLGLAYQLQYYDYTAKAISTTVYTKSFSTTACTTWTPLT